MRDDEAVIFGRRCIFCCSRKALWKCANCAGGALWSRSDDVPVQHWWFHFQIHAGNCPFSSLITPSQLVQLSFALLPYILLLPLFSFYSSLVSHTASLFYCDSPRSNPRFSHISNQYSHLLQLMRTHDSILIAGGSYLVLVELSRYGFISHHRKQAHSGACFRRSFSTRAYYSWGHFDCNSRQSFKTFPVLPPGISISLTIVSQQRHGDSGTNIRLHQDSMMASKTIAFQRHIEPAFKVVADWLLFRFFPNFPSLLSQLEHAQVMKGLLFGATPSRHPPPPTPTPTI